MKKNLPFIIDAALAVAVIALFCVVLSQKKNNENPIAAAPVAPAAGACAQGTFPIAYIDTDTLLERYEFAKQKNEELLKKEENSKLTLTQKGQQFQKDYIDFQQKLQNGIYATQQRAEQEQERLLKQQQKLQELEQKLTEDLIKENQQLNMQLRDSLNVALKEYNSDGRYKMIFGNSQSGSIIFQADSMTNVTDDVLKIMNGRLKKK